MRWRCESGAECSGDVRVGPDTWRPLRWLPDIQPLSSSLEIMMKMATMMVMMILIMVMMVMMIYCRVQENVIEENIINVAFPALMALIIYVYEFPTELFLADDGKQATAQTRFLICQ